ncbi:MAG: signal peptidase I [Patescibacteria group bacterium]|nr:signal peptidase I [Patescibacteria group bacterium]MDE2438368.1 signal peptidase I [Patescibacteria group bacterium]
MRQILLFVAELAEVLVVSLLAVFLVRYFIAQPFLVKGSSMEPTFTSGNYLIIDELAYRFRKPERGEVIVFRFPKDYTTFYIKRIIGLPGETVQVHDGMVTVTDTQGKAHTLGEPYLPAHEQTEGDLTLKLESDQYFVMGDNREFSYDSRSWGAVPTANIIGLVRFRLWPLPEAHVFAANDYRTN